MRRGTLTSCSVGLERLGEEAVFLAVRPDDSVAIGLDFFTPELLARFRKCLSLAFNQI